MLKIGIIGLGKMGSLHLLNALHMKGVKVAAVADQSRKKLKLAERYNVHVYDDYTKLIDSEDMNAVVVSLPNYLKKESIKYASEKGLDIFVDKPLARNLREAKDIFGKARANDVRVMVGVNYRYFDSVQKLKMMLDEGELGDIPIATSELIMDGPFAHPLVPKPIPDWWFDREQSGGGALLDLGYHLIDIFDWLLGDLEVLHSSFEHQFNLPVEDNATVVLRSKRTGTRCIINVGWFSKMIFPNFNFRINLHGAVGYASTDFWAPRNLYFHALKEGTLNLLRRVLRRRLHYLSYTYYYASFYEALSRFCEALIRDEPVPISLEGQLGVMKILENIYKNGVS